MELRSASLAVLNVTAGMSELRTRAKLHLGV
jgi:hypothetical protein